MLVEGLNRRTSVLQADALPIAPKDVTQKWRGVNKYQNNSVNVTDMVVLL